MMKTVVTKRKFVGHIFVAFLLICGTIASCKKEPAVRKEAPNWSITSAGDYPYTMTAVVTLPEMYGAAPTDGDQMAAFMGEDCRGIGTLNVVGGLPLYFIMIHGTAAENTSVYFLYYNATKGAIYKSKEGSKFAVDSSFGTVDSPEMLRLFKLP
ncbi:hypothetical protein FSB73_21065 [Arachidicoccus ginsenosidivorans]|uniref:Lipoprotein n=1 Tax=Arachidicoccus ginsenosidivorans TaxID=496057 RepID=A0A5B8VSQ5_9BACT|nr:hypothetical protein [Arachidicoccus ginsenosidivorans]QEC73786.1 hypothetical protein FSB73_21065 [Arachidicoccus ginsenosidivorans]